MYPILDADCAKPSLCGMIRCYKYPETAVGTIFVAGNLFS